MSSQKSYICTKHFVEWQPADKKTRLLSYLSPSALEAYQKALKFQLGPLQDLTLAELLGKIHPSHFVNVFSSLSHECKLAYLSALSPHLRNEVATLLSIKDSFYEYDLGLREFFLEKILLLLSGGEFPLLPFSQFPDHPLLFLLKADGIELSALCSFLGLFDLSLEIRKLIDG